MTKRFYEHVVLVNEGTVTIEQANYVSVESWWSGVRFGVALAIAVAATLIITWMVLR